MSITRGRRIAGFGAFLLLFLSSCATYHESMDTMRKTFPGAKPVDAGGGKTSPTDNTSPKTKN
jgi:hypothetical protein